MRKTTRRAAGALGALLVVPAVLFLDALSARVAGWTPAGPGRWLLTASALVLLAGAGLLFWSRAARFLASRLSSALVVGAAIVAAWGVAEVIAGRFRIVPLDELTHLRPPGIERVFRPAPDVMPGIVGESRYRINSWGIRGDELPLSRDVYRVLGVGGSTTECLYLDQRETWAHRLQTELRRRTGSETIWVGDVGVSGYASPHHIRFTRGSTLVSEMDCLVYLVGMNDLLWFLGQRDFSVVPLRPEARPTPRLARTALGKLVIATGQRLARPAPEDAFLVEDEAGRNYVERRRLRREGEHRALELPLEAYYGWARRLDDLVTAGEERGIRTVFLTQPALWKDGLSPEDEALLWMGEIKGGGYGTAASLAAALDRYNEITVRVCRERGAECVDLRAMNGERAWFYDDCHFNEAGAAEVARRVADHLVRTGPLRAGGE